MKALYRSMSAVLAVGLLIGASAAEHGLAWPTLASIELPQSSGKFDFLRVDPNRNRLLAAHVEDGTSDFIDLKRHAVIARVKVGSAVDTAMDVDSKFYYVSVQESERVAVLDAATLKEVDSIKTAGPTDAILYEPKNHRVYVTHDEGTDLSVIDPSANAVIAQWPTAPATRPHGLALDAASHRVFSAGANGKLVAIDTTSGAANGAVDITPKVDQIALDPGSGLLYCAGSDRISVVRVSGGTLSRLGELATASGARNVAVDPATRAVWTTYSDGK